MLVVYCKIYVEQINTMCGKNAEQSNVKPGSHNYQWTSKG
jgi:hypothetical protein